MPCIEAVASARIEALQLQALIISDSSTITHLWQLEQVYISLVRFYIESPLGHLSGEIQILLVRVFLYWLILFV